VDRSYAAQVKAYAILALGGDYDKTDTASVLTVWLRDSTYEKFTMSREEMRQYAQQIDDTFAPGFENRYVVNPGCIWCPRRLTCAAWQAKTAQALAVMTNGEPYPMPTTAEEWRVLMPRYAQARERARMVDSVLRSFDAVLRSNVQSFGPLDLGDGKELALCPTKKRRIKPVEAWPVLAARLDDRMPECVTISISTAEAIVAENAAKGQKKAVKEELNAALAEAGAVEVEEIYTLRERRREEA